MNYIVGDIGNTTTRICLLNKNYKINQSVIVDTKKIFIKGYIKNIFKKKFKVQYKKRKSCSRVWFLLHLVELNFT